MTTAPAAPVPWASRVGPAVFAAAGAALLVTKAVVSLTDALTPPAAIALTVGVALLAVATAGAVGAGARLGPPLAVTTLAATLLLEATVGEAPPRLLALVPLAVTTGLLYTRREVPAGGAAEPPVGARRCRRSALPAAPGPPARCWPGWPSACR